MDPAAESHAVPPPGAVAVTVTAAAAAAAPPAATARPVRGAAARPERTRRSARAAMAAALFALGCAAAALAMFAFAMALHPADSRVQLGECAPTDAEAASLRAAAEMLLLAASAQVLASVAAMLVLTTGLFVFFAFPLGMLTAYRATDVAWMLVACHGALRSALAFHYWLSYAVLMASLLAGFVVAKRAIH